MTRFRNFQIYSCIYLVIKLYINAHMTDKTLKLPDIDLAIFSSFVT